MADNDVVAGVWRSVVSLSLPRRPAINATTITVTTASAPIRAVIRRRAYTSGGRTAALGARVCTGAVGISTVLRRLPAKS